MEAFKPLAGKLPSRTPVYLLIPYLALFFNYGVDRANLNTAPAFVTFILVDVDSVVFDNRANGACLQANTAAHTIFGY